MVVGTVEDDRHRPADLMIGVATTDVAKSDTWRIVHRLVITPLVRIGTSAVLHQRIAVVEIVEKSLLRVHLPDREADEAILSSRPMFHARLSSLHDQHERRTPTTAA